MNATNSPFSTKPELAPPLPADLSERIWKLHRTITDPAVKRSTVKDAKRALLGALIVHNELRKVLSHQSQKGRVRAHRASAPIISHFRHLPGSLIATGEPAPTGAMNSNLSFP